MIVQIDRSFEKDTDKIKDRKIRIKIANCITSIINCNSTQSIKNLKKITGYNNIFRIRIGDYRLGLIIEDDTVIFVRCLHRKDIYKYFPD